MKVAFEALCIPAFLIVLTVLLALLRRGRATRIQPTSLLFLLGIVCLLVIFAALLSVAP